MPPHPQHNYRQKKQRNCTLYALLCNISDLSLIIKIISIKNCTLSVFLCSFGYLLELILLETEIMLLFCIS